MVNFGFGIILLLSQLLTLGGGLPQVMEANYSDDAIEAGVVDAVGVVSEDALKQHPGTRVLGERSLDRGWI